jgi:hypothetical protein
MNANTAPAARSGDAAGTAGCDRRPAFAPHRFEISRDARGHWVVDDGEGLVGGVFVTCKDALRFALGEAGGDPAHVHVRADPAVAGDGG